MSEQQNQPAPETEAVKDQPVPEQAQPGAQTTDPTTPEPGPAERIAALEAELSQMKDRWLRAEAEMQNLRTRAKRDVDDARQYAVTKFAKDVVEAAENLRRGLDALPPPQPNEPEVVGKMRGGFEGVERAFLGALERNGIQQQNAQGAKFDPELHQAMAQQPAPEGVAPGTVIQAWTPAWTLNGRLLKPAMVVVAEG
jgi:molecular chaperone GrpE